MLDHLRTGDAELLRQLGRACEHLTRSAALLERMLAGDRSAESGLATRIHAADEAARTIARAVDARTFRTFVLRVDRMEMHGLAAALDASVEAVEETAQLAVALHASGAPASLRALARTVTRATETLGRAIPSAERSWGAVSSTVAEMRRLEEAAEAHHDAGVGELFAGTPDPLVALRWRDVYERLWEAMRCLARAAQALEELAVDGR